METLTNQYFNYRETPVEYDGTGTITDIKGQTLVWNQLVQNGNFADGTNGWAYLDGLSSISASNNICTVTFNSANQYNKQIEQNSIHFVSGHSYLLFATVKSNVSGYQTARFRYAGIASEWADCASETTISVKFDCTTSGSGFAVGFANGFYSGTGTVKNVMAIDLTQLNSFYITDASSFRSYYNLPYYDYTQGKLLPFKGESLKTTGKNLFDGQFELGNISVTDGSLASANDRIRTQNYIKVLPNTAYTFKEYPTGSLTYSNIIGYKADYSGITDGTYNPSWGATIIGANTSGQTEFTFTTTSQTHYIKVVILGTTDTTLKAQAEYGSSATSYESYAEDTITLPISTYFPDGQMSAGSVYDELTETSYIKRVGMVDLGTLDWSYNSTYSFMWTQAQSYLIANSNFICSKYINVGVQHDAGMGSVADKSIAIGTGLNIKVKDSSYTDPASFKTAVSGVMLYYELATPLENYGVVDLGTLDWIYWNTQGGASESRKRMGADLNGIKKPSSASVKANMFCSKYQTVTAGNTWDRVKGISVDATYAVVQVYDDNYNTTDSPSAFKSAMSGIYLYYEKEDPQPITLDLTYDIWDGGTEQLLPVNGSNPVTTPIFCDIDYRGLIPVNAEDDPDGSGVITGTGEYRYHSIATLEAEPTDEIYRFLRWEDENGETVSTDPTYSFKVGE